MDQLNSNLGGLNERVLLCSNITSKGSYDLLDDITKYKRLKVTIAANVHETNIIIDVDDIIFATNGWQFHPSMTEITGGYNAFAHFSFSSPTKISINALISIGWPSARIKNIFGYKTY